MIALMIHLLIIFMLAYALKPAKYEWVYFLGGLFKVLMGFLIGYFYFIEVGEGDTLTFHEQAMKYYQLGQVQLTDYFSAITSSHYHLFQSEARNELFVKIISFFYLISGGNYWVASAYFSFISFLASWYLCLSIKSHFPSLMLPGLLIFLFLPSVVLWSSGVLKDALVNASLYFLAGLAIRYANHSKFRIWEYLTTAIALALLFYFKHYLFAMVVVFLAMLVWFYQIVVLLKSPLLKTITSILVFVLIVLSVSLVNPILHFERLPTTILQNYQIILDNSNGPVFHFNRLSANWLSIISTFPESLFAGFFRPFLWEIPLSYLVFSVESLIVLILVIMNVFYWRSIRLNPLVISSLLYIVVLATLLPMVSPGVGSLVRYKIAYLPFLILLLTFTPIQRLLTKRPRL